MSKITVLAVLAALVFFGWIARGDDNVARVPPVSFTSSVIAAADPVENPPKRRSKIETEALVLGAPLASSLPKPAQDVRYVSAASLRMRAAPSAGAEVVGSYPRDTPMAVKEQSGAWYQVTAPDGRTGWMALKYLSEEAPSASQSATLLDDQAQPLVSPRS